MAKTNNLDSLGGLMYSTNPDLQEQIIQSQTLPPTQQNLRVRLDKKHRGGKTVTLITGFVGNEKDLQNLERTLKNKCGTGGASKNGEIIIQGDFLIKIISHLQVEGYKVKKSGG